MAAHRHLSSSALLVVLAFFLAAVPGLYLFQAMVHRARQDRQHLVANLVVRLNDRTPHHLDLHLQPDATVPLAAGHIQLLGSGSLRGGSFPWKEAPIQAELLLGVSAQQLEASPTPFRLGTGGQGLTARYQEHYLGGTEEPWEPVPCIGKLEVTRIHRAKGPLEDWSKVRLLQGLLELQCHGSGRDLSPSTDDDLHFTLVGTLDYAFGEPV